MSISDWLLSPSGLTPHGFCLSWAPGLIGLHAGSDAVIGLAYLSIPLALASFVRQREDLRYGWVAWLFVAFILACGLTHLLSIMTLWVPAYGVEGLVKLLTAILSIATASLLWPLIPKAVALPSATQLERLNAHLAETLAGQERTAALLRQSEARTRSANVQLERRVAERTAELQSANIRLTEALAQAVAAEETLAVREEEFRISFESAAVGKAQTDAVTGRIIRVNRAFAKMLGYPPEHFVGRDFWEFTWAEDQEADKLEYARAFDDGAEAYVREKRYARRDGSPVWARVTATLARRHGARLPSLAVAVIEDIDERHKALTALKAAKRDLEVVVEQRTVALGERDLLLREVYHRVKNNLQIIDGLLVMQARQLADPAAKAALAALRSRVFALGLVHHQLMGSSDLRTFDIAPFLEDLSANLIESSAPAGVGISVRAAPLSVDLDFAIPLGLLVTELVSNSLKHAFPAGSGHIEVVMEREADGAMTLVVSDNGAGYKPPAAKPAAARQGLGIGIVQGLVKQLKGALAVTHDNGTRNEIRFAAQGAGAA